MIKPPRTCPICNQIIPIDHDFYFDENLNMIHKTCGFYVFQEKSEFNKNVKIFNELNNINK